jgi:hypothetical protein
VAFLAWPSSPLCSRHFVRRSLRCAARVYVLIGLPAGKFQLLLVSSVLPVASHDPTGVAVARQRKQGEMYRASSFAVHMRGLGTCNGVKRIHSEPGVQW